MKSIDEQDILLNEYFKEYRINIKDNGFTKNVMTNLPRTESWISRKDILIAVSLIVGVIFATPYCLNVIRSIVLSHNLYTLLFILICLSGIILIIISAIDYESEFV